MNRIVLFRRAVMAVWLFSIASTVYLSLLPGLELPVKFWNADKVYHLLCYAWLGALPLVAFAKGETARNAAYCMVPLGGLIEWGQSFVPGRASSMLDAVANAVGVFLGMWLAQTLLARCEACRGLRQEEGGRAL
ncbi:hypothetical protein GTA51_04680 [Desulfovibrio aerotolerans]|uniref:VanZ-like domain-containing protein n=1 Tax=Solidesulfovibrio aerotolerans TaxID=295255 RepID=A0A7C9MJW4_9BACT|nr:VanZ family protein [Solidesulfovibrio aerotolerans]MYL82433.1 hypothetical protein [Solidesulfovibrio aerotolerans]